MLILVIPAAEFTKTVLVFSFVHLGRKVTFKVTARFLFQVITAATASRLVFEFVVTDPETGQEVDWTEDQRDEAQRIINELRKQARQARKAGNYDLFWKLLNRIEKYANALKQWDSQMKQDWERLSKDPGMYPKWFPTTFAFLTFLLIFGKKFGKDIGKVLRKIFDGIFAKKTKNPLLVEYAIKKIEKNIFDQTYNRGVWDQNHGPQPPPGFYVDDDNPIYFSYVRGPNDNSDTDPNGYGNTPPGYIYVPDDDIYISEDFYPIDYVVDYDDTDGPLFDGTYEYDWDKGDEETSTPTETPTEENQTDPPEWMFPSVSDDKGEQCECGYDLRTLSSETHGNTKICVYVGSEDCPPEDNPEPEPEPETEDENPQEEGEGALDPDYFDTSDEFNNLMFQSFLQGWVELDYWSDKTPYPVNDINSSQGESPYGTNQPEWTGGDNFQQIQLEFLKMQAQLAIAMANLSIFRQYNSDPKPDTGGNDDEEPDLDNEDPTNGL